MHLDDLLLNSKRGQLYPLPLSIGGLAKLLYGIGLNNENIQYFKKIPKKNSVLLTNFQNKFITAKNLQSFSRILGN